MLDPLLFFAAIKNSGISFFAGVPDSLLKEFCSVLAQETNSDQHVIAVNEGNAIALAAGHYSISGKPSLVYMQNSGLGNAVNPLLSLTSREVFSIPMLLLIGWRGEPGIPDEPQHLKQGEVTKEILSILGIPTIELNSNSDFENILKESFDNMFKLRNPVALLVSKNTFSKFNGVDSKQASDFPMTRECAIQKVAEKFKENQLFISTTGMTSRELYEYRKSNGQTHKNDLYIVGSMGHASAIAMGAAKASENSKIICIDGDGGVLMHMGNLALIGQSGLANLFHIVINNGAHDSVGGQPTVGLKINLIEVAKSCGYTRVASVSSERDLISKLNEMDKELGPILLEIKVRRGSREDLGRPEMTPAENLKQFMERSI
jgi:phosphonopyruvate decarboxylase